MSSESRDAPAETQPQVQQAASTTPPGDAPLISAPRPRSRRRQAMTLVAGLLLAWLVLAYFLIPALWRRYTHRHPSLEDIPGVTHTANGIPADPLNVALVGTKGEVLKIMAAAKWYQADSLSIRSDLKIAAASVLKRDYDQAPVSNLFLYGRKEDLAFEKPAGDNPRQRHHVRFWQSDRVDWDGRPVWVGAAIYDRRVGLSHTTLQITHHTAADIDTERDYLFNDLKQTSDLSEFFIVEGFHKVRQGKNGGGDPWHTDGNLYAGVIADGKSQ